jgi:heterodisulfide reductase subunit D
MKMKIDINLKELERQFSLCIRCKRCTYGSWPENFSICPIYDKYKFFTYCAGGIIYLARAIQLGLVDKDGYEEVLKVISKCTSCGFCGETCKLVEVAPPYQDVTGLIGLLKVDLVNRGVYLSDEHREAINRIKELRRPFLVSSDEKERFSSIKSKVTNKGKILVFSGCIPSYKVVENFDSVVNILNKAKINYRVMDDEWCCGSPLLDLGNVNGIAELAEHNLEAIKIMGVNQVVFLCPHCQTTFQNIYPQITKKGLEFESIFITKYLKELIEKNALKPSKPISYKITYHDPCYLGRHLGDFESARGILNEIPKINLVEMERNKGESYCCGAGGGARILDQENSALICRERMKDFKNTGAGTLVTSCPLCKAQFRDINQSPTTQISIKDTVEILRESLD